MQVSCPPAGPQRGPCSAWPTSQAPVCQARCHQSGARRAPSQSALRAPVRAQRCCLACTCSRGIRGCSLGRLFLNNNEGLHGTLPSLWGTGSGLQVLNTLELANCSFTGVLECLAMLFMVSTQAHAAHNAGTLPASWGNSSTGLPALGSLDVSTNHLAGECCMLAAFLVSQKHVSMTSQGSLRGSHVTCTCRHHPSLRHRPGDGQSGVSMALCHKFDRRAAPVLEQVRMLHVSKQARCTCAASAAVLLLLTLLMPCSLSLLQV